MARAIPTGRDPEKPPRGAEKRLLEAVARLQAGKPQDPGLQVRARARKLKVNATTVTIEAGCARRLAYEFPRVRQALGIDREPDPADPGAAPRAGRKSLQEIVVQLRAENAELRRERDKAVSMAASMVIRMGNLERDMGKAIRKAQRTASRTGNTNQLVGNVHRLFPNDHEAE